MLPDGPIHTDYAQQIRKKPKERRISSLKSFFLAQLFYIPHFPIILDYPLKHIEIYKLCLENGINSALTITCLFPSESINYAFRVFLREDRYSSDIILISQVAYVRHRVTYRVSERHTVGT